MNEQEMIAFELGYDLAMHGRDLPSDAPKVLCDGYRSGARQYPHPQKTDRYLLKWLQIRLNALRRGKRVDASISAEYIARIDIDVCPVTLEPLTHSTGRDSDWSIDRSDNRRGYVAGNVVVISTRANKAKSDLSFEQILANARHDEAVDGLNPEDWQRMALVVAPAERMALGEPPAQYLLGEPFVPGQPYGLPAQTQAELLTSVLIHRETGEFHETIHAVYSIVYASKEARRTFDRLMKDMFKRVTKQGRNWDYWSLKRPLRLFVEFWVTLPPGMRADIADEIGFVAPRPVEAMPEQRATRH